MTTKTNKTLIQKFKQEKLPAIFAWAEIDEGPNKKLRRQEWDQFLIEQHHPSVAFPAELEKTRPSQKRVSSYIKEMVRQGMMSPENYSEFL